MFDLHTTSSTFCCTVDIDELYYARPKVVHRYRKLLNLVESCRSLLESVDITKYNVVKMCQILLRIVDHNRHMFTVYYCQKLSIITQRLSIVVQIC